jgi:hypothetical protein
VIGALIGMTASLLAQTPDVELRLATAGGQTSFRLGEPIGLELSFTSSAPGKYSIFGGGTDRMGMEAVGEVFHVSPTEGTGDPLADYYKGGMLASGLGWFRVLSAEPMVVKKDLNQWLRFDRPGHYRVRAISHRVSAEHKPVEVESNEIEIDLVDDPAWRTAHLAEAVRILRTVPKSGDSKVFEQRMAAARQLWYLDTPASIRDSARLLDGSDVQVEQLLRLGLMASSLRPLAIETMDGLLGDAAQPVTPAFLETLARLKSWSEVPSAASPAVLEQLRSRLAGALEKKTGRAKAISLRTLLAAAKPNEVSAAQRAEMAGLFFDLPDDLQNELLGWQWGHISGPAMIPVLRKIYDSMAEPAHLARGLAPSALARLYELDPELGRRLILAEMARPIPRFEAAALSLLPDSTLPEMEETWIANLELGSGQVARREVDELIQRYATGRILDRVKAVYARVDSEMRSRQGAAGDPPRRLATPACEPALYAYFLRVDPAYGEKLLRGAMVERSSEMGWCWAGAIGETARYFVNPQWQSVALDGLTDPKVIVKIDAVKALAQYGSPDSLGPLWEAFRYWHDWWKDKPAEINEENRRLERAFVGAFTQGAHWVSSGDDLSRAVALCITDDCRRELEQSRLYWQHPPAVSIGQSEDGSYYANLAQYSMRSLEEARQRLLQLPKGTQLAWKVTPWANRPAPALEAWVGQVQRELQDRGVTVAK